MAPLAIARVLLLVAAVGFKDARGENNIAVQSEQQDLGQKLAELKRFLHEDAVKLAEVQDRRLETVIKPSIHNNDPGFALAGERNYSIVEQFALSLTHFWLILCGALVMFMQAGFAMTEAGTCRAKNAQTIVLGSCTAISMSALCWYIFGWSFGFSGPYDDKGFKENGFIGYEEFAGHTFLSLRHAAGFGRMQEPSDKMSKWFIQWAFCAVATALYLKGVSERCNFAAYAIVSIFVSTIVYPIVVAWTWGGGWLKSMNDVGFMDFAGSGIVHLTGGVGALVGAVIAGARKRRFIDQETKEPQSQKQRLLEIPDEFYPSGNYAVVLGTLILWFGWYGMNCGATMSMADNEAGYKAAHVAMNTTISASASGLLVFAIRYAMLRKYDMVGLCNGCLAGLVSITAGGSNVETGSAMVIGLIGALFFQGSSSLMRVLKIDDACDTWSVHGACGFWGTLAAAFFDWGKNHDSVHGWSGFRCVGASNKISDDPQIGCTTGLWGQMIAANIAEVGMILLWAGILGAIVFIVCQKLGLLAELDEEDPVKEEPKSMAEDDVPLHIV